MDKMKWLIIIAFFVIMSFFSVLLLKKQQKDNNKENESRLIIQGKIIRVHKIEKTLNTFIVSELKNWMQMIETNMITN